MSSRVQRNRVRTGRPSCASSEKKLPTPSAKPSVTGVPSVVGAAGPVRFYQKTVGAIIIPDSEPGIYTDALKNKE